MSGIGILAYGSLIADPGVEIGPLIVRRIPTTTPFPVEYARLSRTRGDSPTVVPHSSGNPVTAEVLVFPDSVSLEKARNLLWRRETRNEGSGRAYQEGSGPNAVLVRDSAGFCGLDHALYTDFNPSGKLSAPDPRELARAAVESVAKAKPNMDGISYLMELVNAGTETALTDSYRNEILAVTGSSSLAEALEAVRARMRGR